MRACIAIGCLTLTAAAHAGDNLPPFDFSDAFYLANGINPAAIVGRPNGTPPGSIIDNRENGPDFNNVRILQANAAYDHSGHPVFFSVTGLPTLAAFTNNAAGHRRLLGEELLRPDRLAKLATNVTSCGWRRLRLFRNPLIRRGETIRMFPVQAIALSKDVVILALSGEARGARTAR